MPLRYSDFNIGSKLRQNEEAKAERKDWIGTEKERLNILMAKRVRRYRDRTLRILAMLRTAFPEEDGLYPLPYRGG